MGPHPHREQEEARLLAEPLLQRRREAQLELEAEEPLVRRSPWVNWAGTHPLPPQCPNPPNRIPLIN